jgi:ribose 5-phosphate isomerase B
MDDKKIKIAFGTDHAAIGAREQVKEYLIFLGYEVDDFGFAGEGSCDYPDFAKQVAEAVASGRDDKGILICGTGIGMSIAANKVKGIIAAVVWNTDVAKLAAQHNNANVLCMGSRTATLRDMCNMAKAFLDTDFEKRHQVRIDKIKSLESENM